VRANNGYLCNPRIHVHSKPAIFCGA
jgi:hypothetical protein